MQQNQDNLDLILRDKLAIDRTHLANQRTLLSFFRTSLYLIFTSLALFEIDFLEEYYSFAGVFMLLAALVDGFGVLNFFRQKKRIDSAYQKS